MRSKKKRILAYLQVLTDRPAGQLQAIGAVFGITMLGMVAAFAVAPDSLPDDFALAPIARPLDTPMTALGQENGGNEFRHEDHVRKNDTLASLLDRLGVDDPVAFDFIRNHPTASAITRQMRPGKVVSAATDADGHLVSLNFPLNGRLDAFLVVDRTPAGFIASEKTVAPEREIVLNAGEIRVSLYAATDAAGIPDAIATQLAEIFAGDIDFHRDLRKGDRFAVTYESLRIRGQFSRSGRILAAEFVNAGKTLRAIYHETADGRGGYYDEEGKSLRKAFLRSPLEFSRVTSGFSSARFHPVLKEWRAHRGVDYGAPTGTRVRATGDGVVEFLGRQGGYGNLVVLRHAGGYSTAYGHLNAFAAGLRRGARVAQGEPIGHVGQTGLASGPHLHYEFRIRDQQVNPLAALMPEAPPLDARSLAEFRPQAQDAMSRLALARSTTAPLFE